MPIAPTAGSPRLWGPDWDRQRFRQLGWRLIPLRLFLGVTFVYASLQKIANPSFFDATSPSSFVAQTRALEATSPIAPLLRLSLHAATLVALLIAMGELAVGLGVLAGLWTRAAAAAGMLLSLTFFLTVSWSTTPYFYGSDIVFVFAWSVFAMCGAGGVLSVDAWIAARAAAIEARPYSVIDPIRRQLLVGARSAGLLALFGGVLGGATAVIGRAAGGTKHGVALRRPLVLNPDPPSASPPASPSASPNHRRRRHQMTAQPSGTALGPVSAVPVGQGRQFTDPSSGRPAWLLRPTPSKVVAFSAVCSHAGCLVHFDNASNEFVCPCHGGRYDARTGAVLGGPPPAPLQQIPARIVNQQIRVD